MDFMVIYKNKGIFVVIYFIILLILLSILEGTIVNYFAPLLSDKISFNFLIGLSLILSGALSYFTDTHTFNKGKFEKDEIQINEFFFISMRVWAYMMLLFGVLVVIAEVIE